MANKSVSLDERLSAHPQLKERVEALLAIVEDSSADVQQADEAERRVIAEVRGLGNEALGSWAARQEGEQRTAVSQQGARRAGKKTLLGYDGWGKRRDRAAVLARRPSAPAVLSDGTGPGSGLFAALERRMTDFGADLAFGQVPAKRKAPYGIEVPVSAVRTITEAWAQDLPAQAPAPSPLPTHDVAWLIAETDGSMISIGDTASPETRGQGKDRRKTRQVHWQEARLRSGSASISTIS